MKWGHLKVIYHLFKRGITGLQVVFSWVKFSVRIKLMPELLWMY